MTEKKESSVGKPAVAGKPQTSEKPGVQTRIAGTELMPSGRVAAAGQSKAYWFWVGVLPECPRESIDLAGINFPKVNELLIPDRMGGSQRQRVPVIGALVKLTEDKIRRMRERLPRTVVRFYDQGQKEEPGTGQNLGDNHVRTRRGQIITIPTAEDMERAAKNGKPTRAYEPQPNDTAAACYMFAQLCTNQEKGNRGDVYPKTLDMVGLEWPDKLAEETAELLT